MKKIIISLGFAALALGATAQVKIKDGTITGSSTTPNSNAILELESKQRGLLYPRVALTSTSSASPLTAHVKGMVVYDTVYAGGGATAVTPGIYYNDGTQWVRAVNSLPPSTVFLYGAGTPQTTGASCSSTAQNTIYTDTGSASATLGQTWICDGTNWQTYTQPPSTEWYSAGTANDAGANKIANISRAGALNIYHGSSPTTAVATNAAAISIINDNTGNDNNDDENIFTYGSTSPGFIVSHASGTAAAPANMTNGTIIGGLMWRAYSNGGWNTRPQLDAVYTGNGTTTTASIRLNALSGTITDFSPESSTTTLGTSTLRWSTIYLTTAPNVSSDIRLKKDIEPLKYGLKQIMQIEPISYNLKSGSNGSTRLWGVSAQQMQNILPDVVNVGDDENKTLGVRYEELIPVLINAVKELNEKVKTLESQLKSQQ